jgi:O-antigen/teichoic acid export membrane protein
MGIPLPAISNMFVSLGPTIALFGTFIIYKSGSNSLLHIAIINAASPLLVYITAYIYTFSIKYSHLRPSIKLYCSEEIKNIIGTGIQFFLIQIATVILFMTSNILISKLFTPALVTPFQITYRYFSIVLVIFTVIYMPFWNATTDAYERNDIEWIRQAAGKLRIITIGILCGLLVMILCSDLVYSLWVGNGVVTDIKMSIIMAVYIFILIYSMQYSYFINGIGKLRLQLIFSIAAAILFVPAAYLVAKMTNNIIWFMAVMCIVNTPGMIVNRIQFTKLINKNATGLWNK